MHQLLWACLQKVSGGVRCEQESRQPCFLSQRGSLARIMPWLMGHHWLQQDYSLHHSWMWVLLFLCPLKRSPSPTPNSQATTPSSQLSTEPGLMEKIYRTQKGRWEEPRLLPPITKLVSPESLPAVFINSGVWVFSTGLWKINEICAANWSLWQGKLCNEIDLCNSNTTTYTPLQL